MAQKKSTLYRDTRTTRSSSSSEEEGMGRSWCEHGWEDLSKRFHQAGWLIKEKNDSWNKSLKEPATRGRCGDAHGRNKKCFEERAEKRKNIREATTRG